MKRNSLLSLLGSYEPENGNENEMYREMLDFVRNNPECFERTLLTGHVTASGWVLSEDKSSVLMLHHRKLDRWFQPGGHCDGDPDVEAVARKEISEETGIQHLTLLKNGIFDIDIHLIPERSNLPAHYHYDVRFLFRAEPGQSIILNDESMDVRWVPVSEIEKLNNSESIMRMVRKTIAL
jgi:8-oxo-dGTP pyrophosphatase MutT (NUDIX family)